MAAETLLIATANQSQAFLQQLTAELRAIRDVALVDAHTLHLIDVREQGSFNYASLWDLLNSPAGQNITMLHYIGHSSVQGLFVEGTDDQPIQLTTEALADLLSQRGRWRFVFLNSCCSQAVASALLQVGVPFVIGTSAAIQDDQAVEVAKRFYTILGNKSGKPRTIEEAFRQTQYSFDSNPQNPIPKPEASQKRGGFITDDHDDATAFPWQFYQRDDLTDAQRNWQLIPPPPVAPPAVTNELFTITPVSASASYRPFSFFLSHTAADQAMAKDLMQQIQLAFRSYGTLTRTWSDETVGDPVLREQQLTQQITRSMFIFLLVNDAFLTDTVAQQVVTVSQTQSGRLVAPPVVLPTTVCNWQGSAAGGFNYFPLSNEPLTKALLPVFGSNLYSRWMKWLRQNPPSARS